MIIQYNKKTFVSRTVVDCQNNSTAPRLQFTRASDVTAGQDSPLK